MPMKSAKPSPRPPWHPSMSNGCSVPARLKLLVPDLKVMCDLCRVVCDNHDQDFYEGKDGDEQRFNDANNALYAGLLPLIGPEWAQLWYDAVRIGGWSHWGTGRAWDGRLLWEKVATEQQSP